MSAGYSSRFVFPRIHMLRCSYWPHTSRHLSFRGASWEFRGETTHFHSSVYFYFALVQNMSDKWNLWGMEQGNQAINYCYFYLSGEGGTPLAHFWENFGRCPEQGCFLWLDLTPSLHYWDVLDCLWVTILEGGWILGPKVQETQCPMLSPFLLWLKPYLLLSTSIC